MIEFCEALRDHAFLRNALVAGLLAGLACGGVGALVVTRRITVIAGSLAHTVLGGMGAAYWLNTVHGWTWLQPLHGATFAAVLAALIIGWARAHAREREDTVISALWAVGMAVGILFLFKTPGYKADLMTYLFGNVVMVDASGLRLLLLLDALILGGVVLFHDVLLAVCFDEEHARLRGVNVEAVYTLLLVLTALTIVSLVHVVGVVMVIALVTLPVSAVGRFTRRLWQMMLWGGVLAALLTAAGLGFSYVADLPTGAVTILFAAGVYALAVVLDALRRRVR
jgi:zinc transport system permease protein